MRSHGGIKVLGAAIRHVVFRCYTLQNASQRRIVDVANVLKQVVDDMMIDAAKQMSDPEALCRIVAGGQHVMFGPRVRHQPIFIWLWKMGVLVDVGTEKYNGHGKAGAKLQDQITKCNDFERQPRDQPGYDQHERNIRQFEQDQFQDFKGGVGTIVNSADALRKHILEIAVEHPAQCENGIDERHI